MDARHGAAGTGLRGARLAAAVIAVAVSACGTTGAGGAGSPGTSTRATGTSTAASGGCKAASREVGIVVEVAPAKVISRCVALNGPTVPATTLVKRSGIEVATQSYSFGPAVCQLDHVPAHYSQCLASGKPYWALFISSKTRHWVMAQTGIGKVTLEAGQSIGWRYDSPTGTPAPPSVPPPLR